MRSARCPSTVAGVLVATVTLLVSVAGPVEPAAAQPSEAGAATGRAATTGATVTLITGDEVTVGALDGGDPTVTVRPADPGEGASFSTVRRDGDVFVIPDDVAALVPRVLDRALFNVTDLVEMGYTDAARGGIPLIVRGGTPAATTSVLRQKSALPSIDARAVELSKADAAELGSALERRAQPGTADTLAAGIDKIWLDAEFRAADLDPNLTAVGAPQAWNSGLSGAGVDVAVLDSGVDANHPALAGQVIAQRNFTAEPSAADKLGHGTHVASIIAGTGAVANGARKGVAFAADLLSAKVLANDGSGRASQIIAGMHWASKQGAEVVNLSLGGPAGPADGPVVLALEQLTKSTGTLFVVAAGNSGPGSGTIEAPGTAASALTVGAAAANGGTAFFSSRGPVRGSFRTKPDLTAPGVNIAGAKAGGGQADPYITKSGTSQATPHVAGAAALLLEQHPYWSWREVKTVLATTADPFAAPVANIEGSGLLDLRQATDTTLRLSRPNFDFGYLRYPEGRQPRSTKLRVTNTGPKAQTVSLSDRQRNLDREEAPPELVTLSRSELSLVPGASATVTVTVAPRNGEPGSYSGAVTLARAGHEPRTVPLGFYAEPPRHDVHLTVLDRHGEPYAGGTVRLANMRDMYPDTGGGYVTAHLDKNGQATVRVAPGPFSVMAKVLTPAQSGKPETVTLAGSPEVLVDGETSVTIDARDAQRLRPARVAGVATEVRAVSIHYGRWDATGGGGLGNAIYATPEQVRRGQVFLEPTEPVEAGAVVFQTRWRLAATENQPGQRVGTVYDLLLGGPTVPEPLSYRVSRAEAKDLARLDVDYRALGSPAAYAERRQAYTELVPSAFAISHPLPVPQQRVEFVTAGPQVQWQQCVAAPERVVVRLCEERRGYDRRERVGPVWFRGLTPVVRAPWHTRTSMRFPIGLTDGSHSGSLVRDAVLGEQTLRLFRNGIELKRNGDSNYFDAPPEPATFRLVHTANPDTEVLPIGREFKTSWTFPSHGPTEQGDFTTEPRLLSVDYQPRTDSEGRMRAWRPVMLTLRVTLPKLGDDGSRVVPDAELRFWASGDGGQSWHPGIVVPRKDGEYFTIVPGMLPRPGDTLSVRVEATAEGRGVTQTIIDAYQVRRP